MHGGLAATDYRLGNESSRGYVTKVPKRMEHFQGRCQEEKKEERTVKMNKSKVKPVSSWSYQRKAGSLKALQRVAWSLIFLVFGVRMVNAEEQGVQALQRTEHISVKYTEESTFDGRRCLTGGLVNGNGMSEPFVKKKKKRKTARVRT